MVITKQVRSVILASVFVAPLPAVALDLGVDLGVASVGVSVGGGGASVDAGVGGSDGVQASVDVGTGGGSGGGVGVDVGIGGGSGGGGVGVDVAVGGGSGGGGTDVDVEVGTGGGTPVVTRLPTDGSLTSDSELNRQKLAGIRHNPIGKLLVSSDQRPLGVVTGIEKDGGSYILSVNLLDELGSHAKSAKIVMSRAPGSEKMIRLRMSFNAFLRQF
ncbi:hypothetical protein [Frigidibacter sp. ROC022]|uniref:hypothetical protein n=1 Tax=Frigidibacter sp. ROC022 TaxID=2971796 RepID=UPI00215AD178|nr:hypothetical protein [Frigidibacter sp. ROC022]MCR8723226.1 hypothetical protein [Frigidibacter sp. ROC022]